MPNSAHLEFDTSNDRVATRVHKLRSSPVRDLFSAATRPDVISLSGGMPDVSLIPYEAIKQATDAVVNDDAIRAVALQYGSTDGALGMKKVVCSLMRDIGVRCSPEQVFLTTGAQEALSLIAKTFLDPGDIVITEGPTYLTALSAFSGYEPEIITIPFDDDGMRIDLLEETLKKLGKGNKRVKFIYTIPNFQNPGGVTMSDERRRRLIELVDEYKVMLLEDDPYGRLRYEGGHQIPLKAMDNRVVYLGTISKTMAPGLRVGWIVAPTHVLSKINLVKQGTDLCCSSFDQAVVEHYFTDTNWQKVLQGFITVYDERRKAMLEALEEFFPEEATWTHPEGGFFVWVTLPEYVDTGSMLAEALEAGVTYVPGDSFFPDGKEGKNSMRINFSYEKPENIREAIRRLAEVIEERLELYRVFIDAGAIKPDQKPKNSHEKVSHKSKENSAAKQA